MSTWPQAQIVATPDPGAQVRFDLSDKTRGAWLTRARELSLGEPGFVHSTDGIVETTRTLKLPMCFEGSKSAASAAMVAFSTVLARRDNWLLWRWSEQSAPTWFRLHRTTLGGELEFTQVWAGDTQDNTTYAWDAVVEADGLTYGQQVRIPTFKLANHDQVTDTAGNYAVALPPIKGSMPARLQVNTHPDTASWVGNRPLVNVAAVDPASTLKGALRFQAEALSTYSGNAQLVYKSGTGMTFNGPSTDYNCFEIDSKYNTGPSGAEIISGGSPITPPAGQYKIMLRICRDGGTGGAAFRAGTKYFNQYSLSEWRTWSPSSSGICQAWFEAGDISLPQGMDITDVPDNMIQPPTWSIWHRGDGSNASLYIDMVLLVPVRLSAGGTIRTLKPTYPVNAGASTSDNIRVDDLANRVGLIDGFGRWENVPAPIVDGGYPLVTPGMRNVFLFLHKTNTNSVGTQQNDTISTATFDLSYRPRFAHLAS